MPAFILIRDASLGMTGRGGSATWAGSGAGVGAATLAMPPTDVAGRAAAFATAPLVAGIGAALPAPLRMAWGEAGLA